MSPGLKEVNLKLVIEYDGKNYSGWQRQKNKPTVQESIEKTLQILFPKDIIKLTGAGRTDAGVHALNQAANFRVSPAGFKAVTRERLLRSLNAMLPADITIKSVSVVADSFHARYSAKKRVYKYLITTVKRSYNSDKYFHIKTKFDIDLGKEYCKLLVGSHSFKSMCKNKQDDHNFMCIVYGADVRKLKDGIILFEISANRFLHSMVRAVIGMMINIASSKVTLKEFYQKFKKGEQLRMQFVPANALILDKIIY